MKQNNFFNKVREKGNPFLLWNYNSFLTDSSPKGGTSLEIQTLKLFSERLNTKRLKVMGAMPQLN